MALFLLLLLLFSHRIDPSAGNGDHDNHFSTLIVRFSGTQRIRGNKKLENWTFAVDMKSGHQKAIPSITKNSLFKISVFL